MRKLLMLTAMAFAAMAAFGTAAASAATEARDPDTGQLCPAVSVSGTTVTGGCLVEDFGGTFSLYAGGVFIGTYLSAFDVRVNQWGVGYAVDPVVMKVAGPPQVERVACRNASGATLPWGFTFDIPATPGVMDAVLATCSAPASNPTGHLAENNFFDPTHFGVDGWTELIQKPNSGYYRNAQYTSDDTVDLITVP